MIQDTRRIWDVYTKVLSRKNISVEYSDNVRTAQYYLDDDTHNGRVVIPTFKFLDDETTQMLVSHEIGHALYSKYTQEQMKTYFDVGDVHLYYERSNFFFMVMFNTNEDLIEIAFIELYHYLQDKTFEYLHQKCSFQIKCGACNSTKLNLIPMRMSLISVKIYSIILKKNHNSLPIHRIMKILKIQKMSPGMILTIKMTQMIVIHQIMKKIVSESILMRKMTILQ